MIKEEAAKMYDEVISDLQASVDVHAQAEADHLIRSLTMSKELSELKRSYHTMSEKLEAKKTEMLRERTESDEKLQEEITILRRDSDDICGDLSTSRAKCQKLEEALKFALQDADLSRGEAQDFHMRLNTSKKEVLRLGNLNLEAEKREKANHKT